MNLISFICYSLTYFCQLALSSIKSISLEGIISKMWFKLLSLVYYRAAWNADAV